MSLSLGSLWLRSQIHLVRPVLTRFDAKAGRLAQDKLGQLGSRALAGLVDYEPAPGWKEEHCCWALPREGRGGGAILYLHGGGYVAGSLPYAKLFGGVLAAVTGMPVLCPAYPLAPEHPYPAAMLAALEAYRYMLEAGIPAGSIAIAGESAGGGLSLGLMHRLRAEGLPLPACLVCLSPWTDLTNSGQSVVYNARHDVSLAPQQLTYYADCYARGREREAEVSPALHSFLGFPPALVMAGGDEILLDDARAVLRGYLAAGGQCRLIIKKGMWHAWPLYPTRESGRALDTIDRFIRGHLTWEEGL